MCVSRQYVVLSPTLWLLTVQGWGCSEVVGGYEAARRSCEAAGAAPERRRQEVRGEAPAVRPRRYGPVSVLLVSTLFLVSLLHSRPLDRAVPISPVSSADPRLPAPT